jgi:hypothetical protein
VRILLRKHTQSVFSLTAPLSLCRPDQPSQANLSAGDAAKAWWDYIAPLHSQGYNYNILCTPAPTSTDAGLQWLVDFLAQVNGDSGPTHVCSHYYGATFEGFQEWVLKVKGIAGGRPLMITEFGCQDFANNAPCSSEQVQTFYQQAVTWMDQQDYVAAYAPFGASYLSLVSSRLSSQTGGVHVSFSRLPGEHVRH